MSSQMFSKPFLASVSYFLFLLIYAVYFNILTFNVWIPKEKKVEKKIKGKGEKHKIIKSPGTHFSSLKKGACNYGGKLNNYDC